MKNIPTILSVIPQEDAILSVQFSNGKQKQYDTKKLFHKEMFQRLKDPHFFQLVQREENGYAAIWDTDTDISEYELWSNGTDCDDSEESGEKLLKYKNIYK